MGWTQTEPTLPNGSAWEQTITKNNFFEQNWFKLNGEWSIARLKGKQFVARVLVSTNPGSYGDHPEYGSLYFRCDIGGVTGEANMPGNIPKSPTYWYFIGEADAEETITVVYGLSNSSSSRSAGTVNLTAPALLGATWSKVNGVWRRDAAVWLNVGGTQKKADSVKIKTGGAWK